MWQHPPVTYKVSIHLSGLCERWLCKKGICTQGLSLILVVLFSTYTELETLFSFISIIKVTTVCDHRYLGKRINIVGCWCIISTQWVKFFCWPWEDSLPDDKKVQWSNRKVFCHLKSIQVVRGRVLAWKAYSTVNSVLLQGEFRE